MFVITHTTACETVINMKTHGQIKWYRRYHGDVTLPWYIPSHGSSKAWRAVTLWEVSSVLLPTQPIERDINCYRPSSFPASMSLFSATLCSWLKYEVIHCQFVPSASAFVPPLASNSTYLVPRPAESLPLPIWAKQLYLKCICTLNCTILSSGMEE